MRVPWIALFLCFLGPSQGFASSSEPHSAPVSDIEREVSLEVKSAISNWTRENQGVVRLEPRAARRLQQDVTAQAVILSQEQTEMTGQLKGTPDSSDTGQAGGAGSIGGADVLTLKDPVEDVSWAMSTQNYLYELRDLKVQELRAQGQPSTNVKITAADFNRISFNQYLEQLRQWISFKRLQGISTLSLTVTSAPEGADIYLNDRWEGTTKNILQATEGSHSIRIARPEVNMDCRATIVIKRDGTNTFHCPPGAGP